MPYFAGKRGAGAYEARAPSWTSNPAETQASKPPASGLMRWKPLSLSLAATRAAVASLGHVQ